MLVKIIDDEDKDIGCIERQYLVQYGLRHQIARVIVLSKKDQKILLQQRSLLKDSCPGMWDTSSSGHVDAGEQASTAALRELKEEIGISASNVTLVGSFNTNERLAGGRLVRSTLIYVLEINSTNDVKPTVDPTELETIEWHNIESTEFMSLTPGAKKSLNILRAWLKK